MKSPQSPCAAEENAVKEATKVRFACDQKLRDAGDAAREWSKRAKDFSGTDMWCSEDRRAAIKAEKELEDATADWSKAQAVLNKARSNLEACRKKNGVSIK
ncbi:hypothetical protein [Aquariibacter albus]|uniref:Uncharacterized protein n=1 Tax=Aquariibacter albus TaxID=2759899 RepID=A0A839HPB1_9BURK|nr:hypothetical protein [Aquariibacter albus]MBB1161428.1 hypothetical protein [Aquariibacter albus]